MFSNGGLSGDRILSCLMVESGLTLLSGGQKWKGSLGGLTLLSGGGGAECCLMVERMFGFLSNGGKDVWVD